MIPTASVIIRAKDSAGTIERTLREVRAQSVPSQIVVVDSGSTDGTLRIARRYADQVVQIAPGAFTYGGALNTGAEAAGGDVHLALSSHCVPDHRTWIEDSLALYARDDVAGTNPAQRTPTGQTIGTVHYQTAQDVVEHPWWGYSNHGSSWRASVWRDIPFREDLPAAEDKEWAWRVIAAGWTIAYGPHLGVSAAHRRQAGMRAYARRVVKERGALRAMGAVEPTTLRAALHRWAHPAPGRPGELPAAVRLLSPWRVIEIAGAYVADHRACEPIPVPALEQLRAASTDRLPGPRFAG